MGKVEPQDERNIKIKAAPLELGIFIEDEHNTEVMADPDTSPPAAKKRRESPRTLRSRTASPAVSKVHVLCKLYELVIASSHHPFPS